MNGKRFMQTPNKNLMLQNMIAFVFTSTFYRLAVPGILATSILFGCQEEAAATPAKPVLPTKSSSTSAVLGASQEAKAFDIRWTAPQSIPVGTTFVSTIDLEAKAPFKVNQEYPIKMKLDEGAGLDGVKKVTSKESVQLSKKSASLSIQLKASKVGPVSLTGTLYFSVCTEDRCLIEKRPLQLKLTATSGS